MSLFFKNVIKGKLCLVAYKIKNKCVYTHMHTGRDIQTNCSYLKTYEIN